MRASAADAERVLAALLELAPAGVEQVDGDGWVEYALYGAPGELPALPRGEADVAGARVSVSGDEVADDWAERWRRFHRPVTVGGRLRVRPPWEPAEEGLEELVVDPGQAFGTGAHPTTRLSLELLLGLEPRGSLADLGSGSGVLAIAAARLGFRPVEAVDSEQAAVEATLENARANGVELDVVRRLDLRHEPPPKASVITANLVRPLLLRVAERMERPPKALIVSGLLAGEEDEVAAAFAPLGEKRRLTDAGWSALLLLGPAYT
ncbi:MAG: 50S ribosomal protein L11 methyltransferase [Thermoleophilaceae bacterium]|nr:50S ribosomal protein L11 methyltransferase [Thermoleophilaceae bacterium]